VAVFVWTLTNPTNRPLDLSLLLSWRNTTGWFTNTDPTAAVEFRDDGSPEHNYAPAIGITDGQRNRWVDDMLHFKPEWLSIKIGINDLHRFLWGTAGNYPVEKFKEIYDEILSKTVNSLPEIKILLIDPFYISRDTIATSFRTKVLEILPHYIAVVHDMSEKYNTRLVKTHDVFQNLLKYYETDIFCPEPVHPNQTGHLVFAEEIYQALS